MKKDKHESGQALVEFALILPIMVLILSAIIDFGWVFFNKLSLQSLCRDGARAGIVCQDTSMLRDTVMNKMRSEAFIDLDDPTTTIVSIFNSDFLNPTDGDVEVYITYKLKLLTPMGKFIFGSNIISINASSKMKAE